MTRTTKQGLQASRPCLLYVPVSILVSSKRTYPVPTGYDPRQVVTISTLLKENIRGLSITRKEKYSGFTKICIEKSCISLNRTTSLSWE